jgi:phosphatidate cytidylyltransferase
MPYANSADATGDTVPALKDTGLRVRVLSALVLIPVALAAVMLGAPYFDLLVVVAGMLMAWEWARLCNDGRVTPAGVLAIATAAAAVGASYFFGAEPALLVVVSGAIVAALVAAITRQGPGWMALGTLYASLPCVAILWLRADPAFGLATILWLLILVWAIDCGAYVVGRGVGGPKLAPVISPKKTWSGLAGGVAAAGAVGGVAGLLIDGAAPLALALISAALALVEQAGDLAESAVKRRFGAKDSSGLIPGHGGLLDRIDGLVAVIVVVALAAALGGKNILAWH